MSLSYERICHYCVIARFSILFDSPMIKKKENQQSTHISYYIQSEHWKFSSKYREKRFEKWKLGRKWKLWPIYASFFVSGREFLAPIYVNFGYDIVDAKLLRTHLITCAYQRLCSWFQLRGNLFNIDIDRIKLHMSIDKLWNRTLKEIWFDDLMRGTK